MAKININTSITEVGIVHDNIRNRYLAKITQHEINKIIKSLKNKYSSGCDGIASIGLKKNITGTISPILTYLCN